MWETVCVLELYLLYTNIPDAAAAKECIMAEVRWLGSNIRRRAGCRGLGVWCDCGKPWQTTTFLWRHNSWLLYDRQQWLLMIKELYQVPNIWFTNSEQCHVKVKFFLYLIKYHNPKIYGVLMDNFTLPWSRPPRLLYCHRKNTSVSIA